MASGWSTTFIGLIQSAGVKLPQALLTPPITTVDGRVVLSGGIIDVPAIVITMLITWVLYIGIRESAKINNIIVLIKIAVILLFVLGVRHVSLANLQPMMPFGWKGVMAGAAIIFFAYIGFDAVSTAAEETKNPKKDVPLGLMLCLGVVIVLYVAVAFVLTGIVPYKQIDVGNALPAALARIGIQWGGALVATGAIIGMISTLLVTLYGQIRIFMVMARDGLLPPAFAKVHPKHRTPHLCTWITGHRHGAHRRPLPPADDHRPLQHRDAVRLHPRLRRRHPPAEDAARGRAEVQDARRPLHPAHHGRLLFLPDGQPAEGDLDQVRHLAAGRPGDLFHVRLPPQQAAETGQGDLGVRVDTAARACANLLSFSESEELTPYPATPSDR